MPTLAALIIGLALGAAGRWGRPELAFSIAAVVEPVGALWASALRLLAVPLVVCVLVTSIVGLARRKRVGRLSLLSFSTFASIAVGGAALAAVVTPAAVSVLPLHKGAAALTAPQATPSEASRAKHWIEIIVPEDLVGAIARGQLLAIVLVTIVFATALARVPEENRRGLMGLLEAAVQALFVILRWLVVVAPVAVFALAFGLGARGGAGVAGHLGAFVVLLSVILAAVTVLMYPLAWAAGGIPVRRFARGVGSAQVVAASTRSSLASLPALLDGAQRIGLPAPIGGFVLPLAVAMFKANSGINGMVKLLLMAHMYSIDLTSAEIIVFLLTTLLLSVATLGVPAGGSVPNLPALLAAGMPMEGIVLFSTVDALPDVFATTLNVTADMTAAAVVARAAGATPEAPSNESATPDGTLI